MCIMKVKSVTKSVKRKVNLKCVSSNYDNIEWGTFLTAEIAYENDDELIRGMEKLSKMARDAVDFDIRNNLIVLKVMAEDNDNQALLGNGSSLQFSKEEAAELIEKNLPEFSEKKTKPKKTKAKVKSKTKDKAEPEFNPESVVEIDEDDMMDIDDLLGTSREKTTVSKPKPKSKPESDLKQKPEKEDDGLEGLDFLDVDEEEKSFKPDPEPSLPQPEQKKDDYEEVDLEEFDFNSAAGDLFDA